MNRADFFTSYEIFHWTARVVWILQVVIPLAAAKQLGVLEERLRVARERLRPNKGFWIANYDDVKAVENYEELIRSYLATPPVPDAPLSR